jgi:hypothetical protein
MSLVHSPCDAMIARNQEEGARVDHPGLVISTTILASSLAFIDGSVVSVGLPAIGASLGGSVLAAVGSALVSAFGAAAAVGAALCLGVAKRVVFYGAVTARAAS